MAHLHAAAIADGFLSGLGPRFLSLLYRRIVRSEGSFLLVAEVDGHVPVGFIAGSGAVGTLYRRFLVRDGLRAVASAPIRLLASWRRALETLRFGGRPEPIAGAELLSIAVVAPWQGRRVGRALVERFLAEVDTRDLPGAHVVVGADNAAAIALYGRAGFREAERFELHAGTPSLRMQWSPSTGVDP